MVEVHGGLQPKTSGICSPYVNAAMFDRFLIVATGIRTQPSHYPPNPIIPRCNIIFFTCALKGITFVRGGKATTNPGSPAWKSKGR
jgi:hypothetical protein